jgi:hypothetical protein
MRDRSSWQKPLLAKLSKVWPPGLDLDAARLCDIELGLSLLERAAPNEPAASAWALLTGYPHGPTNTPSWNQDQARAISVARHLLLHLKNRHDWHAALHDYMTVPPDLRGFDLLNGGHGPATHRSVAVAPTRWEVYAATLSHAPRFQRDTLTTAAAGTYLFEPRGARQSVTIPEDLPLPGGPAGHDMAGCDEREPFRATREELLDTACWMDNAILAAGLLPENFRGRLERVHLEMFDGNLAPDGQPTTLYVNGMLHLGGMVSSGKSTLMDVLAVHGAERLGLRMTLVVGDVTTATRRANLFRALGIASAPVVGASNLKRHIDRLHRLESSEHSISLLAHADPGFDFLNTACMLDGLRNAGRPLAFDDAPCRHLIRVAMTDEEDDGDGPAPALSSRKQYGCPFYSVCQRHRGERDLVGARILVATPASLIYSRVPTELARERMRYLELINRESDLVIVDEADQVQVQLDAMFSPGQTLVGRQGNSWLDEVLALKDDALARGGRRQFAESSVAAWNTVADAARSAANRLYALVRQAPRVQRWIEQNYFTAWTLSDELMSWPPMWMTDHRGEQWPMSLTLRFRLETLAFQGEPHVYCRVGVRRWVDRAFRFRAGQDASVYLASQVPWIQGVHNSHSFQMAPITWKTTSKKERELGGPTGTLEWGKDLPGILNRLIYQTPLPNPAQFCVTPRQLLTPGDVMGGIVYSTGISFLNGRKDHGVGSGLMPADRRPILLWAESALGAPLRLTDAPAKIMHPVALERDNAAAVAFAKSTVPMVAPARRESGEDQEKLLKDLEKARTRVAQQYARRTALAAQMPNLTVDLLFLTEAGRDRQIAAICEDLGLPSVPTQQPSAEMQRWNFDGQTLTVRTRWLGTLGDNLPVSGSVRSQRDAIRRAEHERVGLIKNELPPACEPNAALIELYGQAHYEGNEAGDPKFALRRGCVEAHRLSQFFTPLGHDESETTAMHRSSKAWRDLTRQLGILVRPPKFTVRAAPTCRMPCSTSGSG